MFRLLSHKNGFSLVEIVVAGSLFAMVAYFVNMNRGDGRRNVQTQNQFAKMQNIKNRLVHLVSREYQHFPSFKDMNYYACYNTQIVMLANDQGIVDFGLIEEEKVAEFKDCMRERGRRTPSSPPGTPPKPIVTECYKYGSAGAASEESSSSEEVDHCGNARFIAYIDPKPNRGRIDIQVMSVHTSTGKGLRMLRTQTLQNPGY